VMICVRCKPAGLETRAETIIESRPNSSWHHEPF
jgi:hypothetical protein